MALSRFVHSMVSAYGTEPWSRDWLVVVAGSLVGYLLLRFGTDGSIVLADSIVLTPSVGLAVPLGVLFGLPAAIGIAAGALVASFLHLTLSLWSVFQAISLFLLAFVSSLAWGVHVTPDGRSVSESRWWLSFASLTAIVSTGAAAFLAWSGELLGLFPFYVTFLDALLQYVLTTALLAPPLVVVLSRVRTNERPRTTLESGSSFSEPSRATRRAFALIPVLWGGAAVAGGMGFSIRERIDLAGFQEYGAEFLYHWFHPNVFGHGGRRVQAVFGALMLVGWLLTLTAASTPSVTQENRAVSGSSDESPASQGDESGGAAR